MTQFTLYRNVNRATQTSYPFLLDVQNDLLDSLKTRLVIPAMKLAEQKSITRLNPIFTNLSFDRSGNGHHTAQFTGRASELILKTGAAKS